MRCLMGFTARRGPVWEVWARALQRRVGEVGKRLEVLQAVYVAKSEDLWGFLLTDWPDADRLPVCSEFAPTSGRA